MSRGLKVTFWLVVPAATLYAIGLALIGRYTAAMAFAGICVWWIWSYCDSLSFYKRLAQYRQSTDELLEKLKRGEL